MGPVGSNRSFVVVNNQERSGSTSRHGEQDTVVQVTPPTERGESSSKSISYNAKAVADTGGHTDSSLQSIDYFDVTDLRPFAAFNDKIIGVLANCHPRVKVAFSGLSWASQACLTFQSMLLSSHSPCKQTIVNQDSRDRSVYKLLWKIKEIYEFMITEGELNKIRLMPDVLASLSEQVVECTKFMEKYSYLARLWTRLDKDVLLETDAITKRYTDSLDSLVTLFRGHATSGALTNVYHVLEDLHGPGQNLHFNAITRTAGAGLDPTKICLEGTRTEVLAEIIDWVCSGDDPQRVFWLSGAEGTGKSAIVHTVARWLKEAGRLGSFLCFDVTQQGEPRPERLFTTIAGDFANFDLELRQAVADTVSTDSALLTTADIPSQWERLVLNPLRKSSSHLGPVVLVIDALDECGLSTSREPILHVLADESTQLPPNVRVLVTSRPTGDINAALEGRPHVPFERDIRFYISHRVHALRDEQYALLTTKADGLFEWARIACDFISSPDQGGPSPEDLFECIRSLADGGPRSPLDQLYTIILKRAIHDSRLARYRFSSVMRQVLGTLEPLPMASLNEMRSFFSAPQDPFHVESILKSIAPLIAGVTDPTSPVRLFHASFRDFLTDRARSGEFFVELNGVHQDLAVSTLAGMKNGLQFNICGLESSYLRNSDVPDLAQRIRERFSPHLSYSCRFWTAHVHGSTFDTHLANELCSFFKDQRLIFWFEALGLLGCIVEVPAMLAAARKLIEGRDEYTDTLSIMRDAQKFVEMFGSVITQSTPHLYLSALPFAPEQSILAKLFASKISQAPRVVSGREAEWPSAQLSFRGHADWVRSVAVSTDGRWIVSGSDDSTIRVWDAETGLEVSDPLEHSGFVVSVAFSPDGKIIVSGSSDTTIRAWDTQTKLQVGSAFHGHTGSVNSIAFSPHGIWFASGSSDNTIRIWNTKAHIQVALLKGHTNPINSIAASLNGERIVSGSSDGTIRVWSTLTWSQVGGPLNGPPSPVNSVAFSPDGKLIASGSDDSIIRLWDFRAGSQVGTLEGHIDHVTSVAFSVDSKFIVSGSTDRTIRVWDAATHSQVGTPLTKHTGRISSVAISHDGRTIVSGSWDGTIRTWDTKLSPKLGRQTSSVFSVAFSPTTKQIISGSFDATLKVYDAVTGTQVFSKPFHGHTSAVVSVAFSPDWTRVASGSSDKTVRIWDMEARAEVGSPLRGHASRVNSVAFSPDGKWVVSGSDDSTIRVWDMVTSQTNAILEGHKDAVNSIVFSVDGKRLVSGSADKTIRVWDAAIWSVTGNPFTGHTQPIRSVALSQDGAQIASGSSDNTIRLWNVQTGSLVRTLEGHTNTVRSVAFSPDGRYVVSGSDDSTVRVWDVKTESQLGNPLLWHTSRVRSVTLDAERIISGLEDGTVRVWDLQLVLRGDDRQNTPAISASSAGGGIHQLHHVRFSPSTHHALHDPPRVDSTIDRADPIRVGEEGWVEVVGARRYLLFWVPVHWRNTLCHYPPANVMVIPRGVEFDLSKMAHGNSWEKCWVG
ncbi:WD40-repeat-containing domain protein [Boletus coccyginus]|nr:WD40-repeat-containing domain protein [Boletus coccyginus]